MNAPAFRHSNLLAMNDQFTWLPRSFSSYVQEPLQQRPAGSVGKRGGCELVFAPRRGKTRLYSSFVTHPFHLTAPWHLDPGVPSMAVVYLQTPAGGLIQGDRARMQFTFAPQSCAHLTTQAAEKIHSMTANCAVQQLSFSLGAGAYVEYCPEPTILFPGARFAQNIEVTLEPEARLFLSEMFLSHRAATDRSFDAVATQVQVRQTNADLLVRERSLVQPPSSRLDGPGVLGGHQIWGQALLVGPAIPATWSQQLHELLCTEPNLIGGATLLPYARGIGVKVVGSDAPAIRRALHLTWNYLRTRLLGVPAPSFPK